MDKKIKTATNNQWVSNKNRSNSTDNESKTATNNQWVSTNNN